jgi:hypothetical protein
VISSELENCLTGALLMAGLTAGVFGIWAGLSPLWPLSMSAVQPKDLPFAIAFMNAIGAVSGMGVPVFVGYVADRTGLYALGVSSVALMVAIGGGLIIAGSRIPGAKPAPRVFANG